MSKLSDTFRILVHEWDCMYYDQGMPQLTGLSKEVDGS